MLTPRHGFFEKIIVKVFTRERNNDRIRLSESAQGFFSSVRAYQIL